MDKEQATRDAKGFIVVIFLCVMALFLLRCGGIQFAEQLDGVGAACAAKPCRAGLMCAGVPVSATADSPLTCFWPRQNGEHCPEGGMALAWGVTTKSPSGVVVVNATFACTRWCNEDSDCPATGHCVTDRGLSYCMGL